MTEPVLIALITSLGALAVAGITAYFTYKSNQEVFALKDKVEHQQERITALEGERDRNRSVIDGWRKFWARFVAWLKTQNLTGYPEPDSDLLDTNPRMPPAKEGE